ncbi:MAG: hypothetical protein KIT46_04330 [Anaerolineales bacterium]|nr:hypothetical protein [Anaerolineales bacterium]MCW5855256.1 hypothetical protein [Anaerolineales bacterium]
MSNQEPEITSVSSNAESDGRRGLRIVLWFIAGALIFSALCCLCTLVVAWFGGDYIIDFLRSY